MLPSLEGLHSKFASSGRSMNVNPKLWAIAEWMALGAVSGRFAKGKARGCDSRGSRMKKSKLGADIPRLEATDPISGPRCTVVGIARVQRLAIRAAARGPLAGLQRVDNLLDHKLLVLVPRHIVSTDFGLRPGPWPGPLSWVDEEGGSPSYCEAGVSELRVAGSEKNVPSLPARSS